jgi:hypothetical protein
VISPASADITRSCGATRVVWQTAGTPHQDSPLLSSACTTLSALMQQLLNFVSLNGRDLFAGYLFQRQPRLNVLFRDVFTIIILFFFQMLAGALDF